MESKRNFEEARLDKNKSKKVCFIPDPQVLEYLKGESDDDIFSGEPVAENDLDLDTLRSASSRSRRVKTGIYSDEEESGNEEELDGELEGERDDEKVDVKDVIKPPSLESSGEEDAEDPDEVDGIKVIPFNMKQERQEGDFDGEDNYRVKADEDAYQDNWLEGISKADILRAKKAEEARVKAASQQNNDAMSLQQMIQRLHILLEPGETVSRAIQRRSKEIPVKRIGQKPKGPPPSASELERHALLRGEIQEITDLATRLLDRGYLDIYETPRDSIQ